MTLSRIKIKLIILWHTRPLKIAISLVFGLASVSHAAHSDTTPIQSWHFGAEGIYSNLLAPSLHYATNDTFGQPPTANDIKTLSSNNTWSSRLEAGYQISQVMDVNVNWFHLRSNNCAIENDIQPSLLIPALPAGPGLQGPFNAITGFTDTKLDTINFELGRSWHPRNTWHIRYHVGLQYVHLINTENITGTMNQFSASTNTRSDFSALGPRIGLSLGYAVTPRLSIVGSAAGAVLIGQRTWHQEVQDILGRRFTLSEQVNNTSPAVDARIGIELNQPIATALLTVTAGYQTARLFDSWRNSQGNIHSFGYHGPYLGLKVMG